MYISSEIYELLRQTEDQYFAIDGDKGLIYTNYFYFFILNYIIQQVESILQSTIARWLIVS